EMSRYATRPTRLYASARRMAQVNSVHLSQVAVLPRSSPARRGIGRPAPARQATLSRSTSCVQGVIYKRGLECGGFDGATININFRDGEFVVADSVEEES